MSVFFLFSGVVTLSCTDSNTTSSDTSDPGSPYSPTSASDDAAQNSMMKGSPTNLKNLKRQSTSSDKLNVGKRAKKDDKNNNSNAADIRVPQLPTKPSLVTLSSASNKVAQIMPVISLVSTTQPPNLATLSSASNKMTGYYKQKKDLNSILTPNNISDPIIKKHFEQYCQIISSSAGSQNGKLNGPPATTVATAITNISKQIKKLEKKTPKVAPVLPVARKIASNLHPQLKISPKKPVSIAPRIIEPKRILPQKQAALVSPQKGGKMSSPQQTVLLTAIRIPSNQFQQQQGQISQPPPLKMQNGLMHKSTTSTTTTTTKIAPYMASVQYHQQPMLPNLIHLPNILAAQHNMQAKTTVSSSNTSSTQNIYVNNSMSTQQQQSHQLYSMNGAILKFQPIVTSQAQQTQSNGATHVSYTQAAQQQKLNQIAHQMAQINTQQLAQQLFMTTPVMFNGLPVLSSQLASLQQVFNQQQAQMVPPTTIPALQPIQNNSLLTTLANLQAAASSGNSTTTSNTQSNSIQLPSINTLLHHHNQNQQFHLSSNHFGQALTNIPLSTQQLLKYSSPQAYNSLPPSLTITSNFMQQQRSIANSNTSTYVTNAMPTLSSPKLAPLTQNTIPITFASMPKLVPVSQQPILHIPKAPVTPKPSPIKMPALTKSLLEPVREKQILVVAPLPSPAKKIAEIHVKVEIVQKTQTPIPEIVVKKEEIKNELEISIEVDEKVPSLEIEPCAKSPMLQQPKTIRFPATHGTNGKGKRFIKIVSGMCSWEKCGKKFDNNSILLEHVQQNHVSQQAGPFMCSWDDCKVNGRESCSRKWIERHVLCHVGRGAKPFKCIVDKCGIYFGSQVNNFLQSLILT